MAIEWMHWSELPILSDPDRGGTVLQLCERLLQSSLQHDETVAYKTAQLTEVAAEMGAQWVAVLRHTPQWRIEVECGRHALKSLPVELLVETLDRDQGAYSAVDGGWFVVAVPLHGEGITGSVLMTAGRNLPRTALPNALLIARAFEIGLAAVVRHERDARRCRRLETTLEVAHSFSAVHETEELLEVIASEATRLLLCDRSSIFIWDRERKQVVACPALGVEGQTLRLPDNVGIVGESLHSGRSIVVDDAYSDPRFNQQVDKQSGYKTRNLLCVPVRGDNQTIIGAFEGINKLDGPFDEEDEESLKLLGIQAAIALRNLKEREQLLRSRDQLTEQVMDGVKIIGESSAIAALRDTIGRLAATDLPVLILGESGTGKEVVSQALHFRGPRSKSPFVAVNCAALTETLLESELFGHEKGAFTDAHDARQGKFELAESGTLFLDEIGDMSLNGQAKLLRVLEQKVITRVGGSQPIPINVRVLAATNANLAELVRVKKFREDLYYRLSVVTLDLPPLRDRPEDILPLAEFFLRRFSVQARRPSLSLSSDARRRLQAHAWPGNVRELRNLMERVAFLSSKDKIEVDDLAFILSPDHESGNEPALDVGLDNATRQFQCEYIRRAVKRVNGNMSEAARLLHLHRSNLYRKMRQLKMDEAGDDV